MFEQIKIMTKLELCNLYGLNVLRFTRNKKAKRKALALAVLWVFLVACGMFYLFALSYGLAKLGLEEVIPIYLIFLSSLIIFIFSIFKAGPALFKDRGYTMLCSLPVPRTAIVVSRFLRMYVEDLVFALLALLPGLAVYGFFVQPGISFYLCGTISVLLIPLLPLSASAFIGAAITGISSRMKHKSLAAAGLSILVVLAALLASFRMRAMEEITPEQLKELSALATSLFAKIYPPAVWLGQSVIQGSFLKLLACAGGFGLVFTGVIILATVCFHPICQSLYATSARHDYRMQSLKTHSVLLSLCGREFRRYFSSSVYLTNTIIGPVLGAVLAGAAFFLGIDSLQASLQTQMPVFIDLRSLIPIVAAGTLSMSPTTCVSISMEGKYWWIARSLPLSAKKILDAKVAMYLFLVVPFYILMEIFLIAALKPNILNLLWILLLPVAVVLFSALWGLAVNLRFPVLNWESEVSVVKQSVSSAFGALGSLVLILVLILAAIMVPTRFSGLWQLVACFLMLIFAALLYCSILRKNSQFPTLEE